MARAGKRITRVTTKAGDRGTTTLADGSKLPKTHPRMHAIGDIDELNSFVGLLVCELAEDDRLRPPLAQLQQELFDLGAHLATLGIVPCPDAGWIEALVEQLNADLPPLREFVIPGGVKAAALAHVCRATCRRAERSLWALREATNDDASASEANAGNAERAAAVYANRLSDLLFVMARSLNHGDEPQWRGSQG